MNSSNRYDHLTREELIALLERRDSRRVYGLVWEREGILRDAAVNDEYVAFDLDESLSTETLEVDGWRNLVIEGDNWDGNRSHPPAVRLPASWGCWAAMSPSERRRP